MMRPLPRPSVSPLPSYASRPGFAPRPATMAEMLRQIVAWWRGEKPTLQEQIREAKLVDVLAKTFEEEEDRSR